MTLKLELTKISHDQWFKVFKAFVYALVSFAISLVPALLAHNPAYTALTVPINGLLVVIKQLATKEETAADAELTPEDQDLVNTAAQDVEHLTDVQTDLPTTLVEPTAPTDSQPTN